MTVPIRGPQAALIRFSIRWPGIVIAMAAVLLGYGIYLVQQAKYDVFPEFAPPQAVIQTEAPGLSPEQVELLVTQTLENSLNGVPGLQSLRSSSIQGLSVITMTFDPATDIYRDRQIVAERLAALVGQLPRGVQAPSMTPLTSSASLVLVIGLTSEQHSLMELRTTAQFTLVPRLLAVPGVSKVAVFGGEVKSIQIQVHPDALTRFNLGLNEIVKVAQQATGIRGAGFIDTANQRLVLETDGQSLLPQAIARTAVVTHGGASVTIGDVADVIEAPEAAVGGASINGQRGVVLNVSEQYEANTREVTNRLEAALQELRPGLQRGGISLHADLFRPANFIDTATGNVQSSLLLGGLLVIIILFVFLFDFRTAAISCLAIPLSLLSALIIFQRLGVTLNTMTLGGLAISIGVVVDDAVVDVESVVRRLRENRRAPQPRPAIDVILTACLEVRGAVVYATFAVILVALPVLGLSGIAGRLFAPLAMAYMFAVLASLVVALTVVPALSAVLLSGDRVRPHDPPLIAWSRRQYARVLASVSRHPAAVLGAALGLTAGSCAVVPFLTGSFIPELKEGHFTVHMAAVPGTSIAESLRLGELVTKRLLARPAVRSVAQRVGRAELADDTNGTHYSEFEVDLKSLSGEQAESAEADVRQALAAIPGVSFAVNTFLTERIQETLSGYTAPVAVNVFGRDLGQLDRLARQIAKLLNELSSAVDVQVQSPAGMPQLKVKLRTADLERWGVGAVDVLEAIRTAYEGEVVAQAYERSRVFPIVVILDTQTRTSLPLVAELPLRTPSGTYVRLRQLAEVYQHAGRYQVQHQGARRVQTVTTNVAGRDVASFVHDAKAKIAANLPSTGDAYIEFAGTAEAQSRSQRDLLVNSVIAGIGVLLLLSIVTRSARNLLLVLANLPFAFVGGVLAVFAWGGLLSLGSMIGFVTLLGITLRNSILMIAHYEHLVAVEKRPWNLDTALLGAADRLAPILMTSLVTALGVLPLALGMNEPGREIEGPMALVILGGLLSSMVLNLLVLPTLALRFGRFASRGTVGDHP